MSRIENSVKPLLADLIRGRARLVTPEDCRLLAAWCQLKCICIDARYGGGYESIRHLPPEVAHAFGQREQPLLSSSVAVERFEAPPAGVMLRWGRHMVDVAGNSEQPPMRLVTVSLAIGSLVAKVDPADFDGLLRPIAAGQNVIHTLANYPAQRRPRDGCAM
jgi:hypothetical protein